ncbi:MAG: hypothetical protein RLZZ225_410 [Pseudomonadota bacterium]
MMLARKNRMPDKKELQIIAKQITKPSKKAVQQGFTKKLLNSIKEKKLNEPQILQALAAGVDVNLTDEQGKTLLHHAVGCADKAIVKLLLTNKIKLNVMDKEGKTALHCAIMSIFTDRFNSSEIAKLLIDNQADVNSVDKQGKTALHYAVICRNKAVVKRLIENKAKLNIADEQGKTALHHAAIHRNVQIAELLIKARADVNAIDKQGETALHAALRLNRIEISKLLIRIILLENPQAEKPEDINSKPSLFEFWDACCAQINAMQKESILVCRLSVYEFYKKEMSELVKILAKCALSSFKGQLDTPNLIKNFPLFSDFFPDLLKDKKDKLEKLMKKERDMLLGLAKKCKISSKDNSVSLNEDTLLEVLKYLPMTDIKSLLKADLFTIKPTETISATDSSATATLRLGVMF